MEISLAEERAYYFVPQITLEVAQDRVESKKTGLIAGTVSSLISRPNPSEMPLISVENRLEPFWVVTVATHTVYDRQAAYSIPIKGEEVREVTLLGQKVAVTKGSLTLNGIENCVEERRAVRFFDGLSGQKADLSRYQAFAKTEVADLANFAPEGMLVVPPELRATAVVRQVLGEVIQPVSRAQVIHEEKVNIEAIELNFRPVYALEYEWTSKGKRVVIEFDALLGDMRSGGKKWSDQIKGILTRDLFFDVTADAVGMIVPGGSIAVKLVKAVVDRGKK